mmetsp:Transcript_53305/g.99232  ORF Transcript_53305/g.99232 Transcript_53305/m.99232 type:complete len:233 (-) Transcript_53305:362-1060(-)
MAAPIPWNTKPALFPSSALTRTCTVSGVSGVTPDPMKCLNSRKESSPCCDSIVNHPESKLVKSGWRVGADDGTEDGISVGTGEGCNVGMLVGPSVGVGDGSPVGLGLGGNEGTPVGKLEGEREGRGDGAGKGSSDGPADGGILGAGVGGIGTGVGSGVGPGVDVGAKVDSSQREQFRHATTRISPLFEYCVFVSPPHPSMMLTIRPCVYLSLFLSGAQMRTAVSLYPKTTPP